MTTAHLNDTELQLYITDPQIISQQITNHMQDCAICQSRVAEYILILNNIKTAAKPVFDFDLSALVMEQLPVPKRAFPWAAIIVPVFSIAIVAVSLIFFLSAAAMSFKAVSGLWLTVAIAGAVTILIFQGIEMFREHQKRVDAILNRKILQL